MRFWINCPGVIIILGVKSRNRKRCRQTMSRQSTPLSTIRTRYGNSVSTPGATRTGKNKQNSLQREADTEFQYRPHIADRTTIADAIFADAISETPIKGLCLSCAPPLRSHFRMHFTIALALFICPTVTEGHKRRVKTGKALKSQWASSEPVEPCRALEETAAEAPKNPSRSKSLTQR